MSTRSARLSLLFSVFVIPACAGNLLTGTGGDGGRGPSGADGGRRHFDGGLGDGGQCGDGSLDWKGCPCDMPGATHACYTGPAATENVGLCKDGVQTCAAVGEFFYWGPCTGDVTPTNEVCTDNQDHNCNGLVGCSDPACVGIPGCCTQGQNRSCYDGPAGTENVGQCKPGTQTCDAQGAWQACMGEVLPGTEAGHCTDGIDNDCNGLVDCQDPACANDPACQKACQPGTTQACYDGPAGTENVGQCKGGTQICNTQGQWTMTCVGEVLPGVEGGHCHDGIDNDCNGLTDCQDPACANDAGCIPMSCQPGSMQACYTGPQGTGNVGQCKPGVQVCNPQGMWSTCVGEVLPGTEAGNCHNGIDDDCNGLTDCMDPACFSDPGCMPTQCQPGATQACYTGPAGTENVGQCRPGIQTCGTQGTWNATCASEVLPGAEAGHCHDGIDNDCNGLVDCMDPACFSDPGCQPTQCQPGATQACYDGPAGTENVGPCRGGTQTCGTQGTWNATCFGEVLPGAEAGHCHDSIDNDCNGLTDCADPACFSDPGCVCQPGASMSCYGGPAGTEGVGQCKAGTEVCATDGSGWGSCIGEVLPGTEAGNCNDGIDNDCNGLTDCADPACLYASNCCVPTTSYDTTVWATSATDLYIIDPSNWSEIWIGSYGVSDHMTDIAMTPNGNLYTISSTALYSVDSNSGAASFVMSVPGVQNNALTFLPDSTLLAADAGGTLKVIDPVATTVTNIGSYGNGYGSSGDLVAVGNGTMFGVSATDFGGANITSDNLLITVDTANGAATPIGYTGFANVFGLAYNGSKVIAVTGSGQILDIDPVSGAGTLLSTQSNAFYGATTSPLIPINGCP